jgi:hypothetical protein
MSKYSVSPMVSTARLVYSLIEPQREGRRAGVGSEPPRSRPAFAFFLCSCLSSLNP